MDLSPRARLDSWLQRTWYSKDARAGRALAPLAWLFGRVVAIRRALYRRRLLPVRGAGIPVVVVGNITVGGTGKTPIVRWLATELAALGFRCGIVSRGYRGSGGRRPWIIGSDSPAAVCGDEPLMLARATGVPVCVGADRPAAVSLLARRGIEVVLSDDGMQHYRMERHLEIAVIDGERGLGNGRLLPAGPLREPAGRLEECDFVLANGGGPLGEPVGLLLEEAVALDGKSRRPLAEFKGCRVLALAGIGNPQRFFGMLEAHGIEVRPVPLPDHGRADLAALAAEGLPVLMTDKDAVKYGAGAPPDTWSVPARLDIGDRLAGDIVAAVRALCGEPAGVAG